MEVSDVVKLEEQLALSSVSGAGNGAGEEDDEKRQFLSESKPGKKAQRTFGSARKLVASTFLDEVVVAEQRDAVVYFATPKATPRLHAATLANVHWLAEQTSSKGCLVGVLDVELNHVPPPYGTHLAAGASVRTSAAHPWVTERVSSPLPLAAASPANICRRGLRRRDPARGPRLSRQRRPRRRRGL